MKPLFDIDVQILEIELSFMMTGITSILVLWTYINLGLGTRFWIQII